MLFRSLAGFRIGYGIMDREVAQILNRIRQPFDVNTLAQVAAQAAIQDEDFLNISIRATHEGIDFLSSELTKMGLSTLPTQSNFLMVDLKTDASLVFTRMLSHGVIVRGLKSYGFDTFLRVNTGTKEENKIFINALKKVLDRS